MAVTKGYRSYRGRAPRGKIALAVVLVLVIVASIAAMVLQEYCMVYDADGNARLEFPWQRQDTDQTEDPLPEGTEDVEVTVQAPETPDGARVLWLTDTPLTTASGAEGLTEQGYDAVAVTVKDSSCSVYYDSEAALPAARKTAASTAEALAELNGGDVHTIARLACLLDSRAANADVEGRGLKNTGGYIFYDGNNQNWLDPSKEGTRTYLGALAVECADLGFDEILLTDLSFPTEGKLDKIRYPEEGMAASLTGLLEALRSALDEAGHEDVLLSAELPAEAVLTGQDDTAGVVRADIAPLTDRIYARTIATQAQTLADAVEAAGGSLFVPELQAVPQDLEAYLVEAD